MTSGSLLRDRFYKKKNYITFIHAKKRRKLQYCTSGVSGLRHSRVLLTPKYIIAIL